MMSNEAIPHQKSLVAISIGLILYGLGEGDIKDSVSFALIGVTLREPVWLLLFIWASLFWSFWRFWINNDIQNNILNDIINFQSRNRLAYSDHNRKYLESRYSDLKWSSSHTGDHLDKLKILTYKRIKESKELFFNFSLPNKRAFWCWVAYIHTDTGQINGVKFYIGPFGFGLFFQMKAFFKAAVSSNSVADYLFPVVLFMIAFIVNDLFIVPFFFGLYWFVDRCMDSYPDMEI